MGFRFVVIVAQLCEYTKNYRIIYFKGVNFIICELYLNKDAIKKTFKKPNGILDALMKVQSP